MNDFQPRFEQLMKKLRQSHHRLTPQRVELVRLITSSPGHPTAAQIFENIIIQFPTMSFATVYKTLSMLKKMGEVIEISLHTGKHYDAVRPFPHLHLICTSCQKISDGEPETPIHAMLDEMSHRTGFQIHYHQLVFYGLCPDCQKNVP